MIKLLLADLNIEHIVGVGLSCQAGVEEVGHVGGRTGQNLLHLLPPTKYTVIFNKNKWPCMENSAMRADESAYKDTN